MRLMQGDCLNALTLIPRDSVDSIITDPPAGISFMGKAWDNDKGGRKQWIEWMSTVMVECLRVLKPGGHALIWAIPRTSHWTATAVEDTGFEVRDVVTHLFGSGFPKSLNIEKATNGIAKGQGTALKPAAEFWILARKPLSEKTVAKNVLKHGTGGLNIDASRIGTEKRHPGNYIKKSDANTYGKYADIDKSNFDANQGRFPANLVLSGDAPELLDEQSGTLKSGAMKNITSTSLGYHGAGSGAEWNHGASTGGASRFFYCAKVSPSERGETNTHPTVKPQKLMQYLIKLITPPGGTVLDPFMGSDSTGLAAKTAGFGFIGIEKEKEYYDIAEMRIKNG